MSTYPASLDDLGASNPSSSTQMDDGAGHAAQHVAANDAIDAIQATLGVDPFGVTLLPDPTGADDGDVATIDSGAWVIAPPTGGGGGGGDTEGAIDTIDDVDTGGALTDDGTYYYLTFDTPGIFPLDVSLTAGDYANVDVYAWGAAGAGGNPAAGGAGAYKKAACKVRAGRYAVVVGQGGDHRGSGAGPGTRPIGYGGLAGPGGFGGQGGGLTGLFRRFVTLAQALLIAGAGGGGGWDSGSNTGGAGGDEVGADGGGSELGTGGGVAAGYGPAGTVPATLTGLQGGDPSSHADGGGGGGGGAGAMGGGPGGNSAGGGGGGGNSFANDECTSVSGASGSGTTPGGTGEALYPGSPMAVGGASGNDGNPGYLVMRWPM